MEIITTIINFIIHLDKYLDIIIRDFGVFSYFIFFVIVFCETGLVVMPFLPGDSLLFIAGTFAAKGSLNVINLFIIFLVAAIAGDSANYAIGKYFGNMILKAKYIPFFKKEHLEKTHKFYEKYGAKTIVLARFVPLVRTFAPFVAGLGAMDYRKFFFYNCFGGFLWVAIFVLGGYLFGNIPFVKENLTMVVFVIIILSMLPGIIGFLRHKKEAH